MGPLPQNGASKVGDMLRQEIFSEFVEFCDELCIQLGIKASLHAPNTFLMLVPLDTP